MANNLGLERIALDDQIIERLRRAIPDVADEAVMTIVQEVPSYGAAYTGQLGRQITTAVQLALLNFLELARAGGAQDPAEPIAPSTTGAYELGRGEARSGRSMDALLAAYRIGARVAWRGLSREAVVAGVPADALGRFAELVFAYIDALSAASIAGHHDELTTTGRVLERYRERLGDLLLRGADDAVLLSAARRAEWSPVPRTLTGILVPEGQARTLLPTLDPRSLLVPGESEEGREPTVVLLVPDIGPRDREVLLRRLSGRGAVLGPERPWQRAAESVARARRASVLLTRPPRGAVLDTEAHLPELALLADADVLRDLRRVALAPLEGQRPAARARLEETLRAWLLHQGRRDEVARELFVHPQTVRYRLQQLRRLYGERLDDPAWVLRLTLALALPPEPAG